MLAKNLKKFFKHMAKGKGRWKQSRRDQPNLINPKRAKMMRMKRSSAINVGSPATYHMIVHPRRRRLWVEKENSRRKCLKLLGMILPIRMKKLIQVKKRQLNFALWDIMRHLEVR